MSLKQERLENANDASSNLLSRIHEALELVHSPYSTNQSRQEASVFLEEIKTADEAPYHGFTLASDRSQQSVVRHYALSLIEHAIKHKWPDYSDAQALTLREWVLRLSESISQDDPLYLRNKTAYLWVEVAKRSWATEWTNMDELLVQLWDVRGSVVHKEFVLFVLETLSEEIFNSEDATAALREGVLSKACVEIFTPAIVFAESFPNRQPGTGVRSGDEGWLIRIGQLLDQCLGNDVQNNEQYRTCAIKVLAVFRSVMPWAIPSAIATASCVKHICGSLAVSSVPVQMASIDALHALYSRTHLSDKEFLSLVCPMYTRQIVDLLRKLYEWSTVDPHDIDCDKHLFAKRFSEVVSNLGNFIELKISMIPEDCDLPNLLELFLSIVRSQSFVVSIPVLVTWTRLLRSDIIGSSPTVTPMIAPLLEICSSRLIRYEALPEDLDDPCMLFLLDDIDTVPERHAFLGNYRRYSVQVIELIVRRKQSDAIYHILSQVGQTMQNLYDGYPAFSIATYSKTSTPILRVDAQFTVVEAALKGYMKWRQSLENKSSEEQINLENNFEVWCNQLLEMKFEDPIIRKRILQLAVAFSTSVLDKRSHFMLAVLEHILMSTPVDQPGHQAYSEAVKELQNDSMHELARLATRMPDQLLDVFDQLEAKVNEIMASGALDPRQQVAYQTFLFTIIHRATTIELEARMKRLESFIAPVRHLWQNPALDETLSSFDGFCALLGIDKVRDYIVSRRVHEFSDWAAFPLDPDGQAIQTELNERVKALPLRPTKSFLGCSTDKIEKNTDAFKVTCALWRDAVPAILPDLLKFLSHAHAFHNPTNWLGLPAEVRPIIGRILTDRFWQAGISEGSKEDFYARVSGTKSTMEGLASSIRGSVRTVREACYSILYGLSRLDVHFYGFDELPGPLANALFANAHCLSSHQLINLLNLVRYLVDDCPVELRDHFVPPILATFFAQIDSKVSSEWDKLGQKQQITAENEDLAEEMKEESILRQLTHSAVMMVASLLDPARLNPGATEPNAVREAATQDNGSEPQEHSSTWPSMRNFCLSSPLILEPLIIFCTHAIRMRDTRCCGIVLRVFRSIIPEFSRPTDSTSLIREFICSDVLKACITSLHEPYFVDLQRELAQLIATVLICYCPLTNTPRQILLSLPGVQEKSVSKCIEYVGLPTTQQRQQRASVLDLLQDLKGVSISEQGRITKPTGTSRKERSKMQQEFMKVDNTEPLKRQQTPDLEGVASMFGG